MELIERTPLKEAQYLDRFTFKDFKPYCKLSCKNDDERQKLFRKLKSFIATVLKTRGETKRIYSFTLATNWGIGGRLFCANSMQGLPKHFRGFILRNSTTDIDMKNCHPKLLMYLCKKNEIPCPSLQYYDENREEILAAFPDREEGKTAFLKALNDDKTNEKIKNSFFKNFDKECKIIQKKITGLELYRDIVKTTPEHKKYNWYGSAINRVLCTYENLVLQVVVGVLNARNIEICTLMFDGLMVYGNHYKDRELLEKIETAVEEQYEGLKMKFEYKEHSNEIEMPDDFEY
jgi:hypothetical protein